MRGNEKKRQRAERLQNAGLADATEVMKDPAVLGIILKLRQAPTEELRLQYSNQLTRLLSGESLEDVNPELGRKFKKLAIDKDKAAEQWQKDRMGFVTDIIDQATKDLPTGDALERKKAELGKRFQASVRKGKAARSHKRLHLLDQLRNGPKETIFVEGHMEIHGRDDNTKQVHMGVEIGLFDQKFYIPPGMQTVPKIIADKIREKRREDEELQKRQSALQGNLEWSELGRKMDEIDTEYNTESFLEE